MSDEQGGFEEILDGLYPYRRTTETYRRIPATGRPRDQVLAEVRDMAGREDEMGDEGRVSGSLYCGDHDHYHFLTEVFEEFAHANVLQRDMYPSATKFEAEIVAMVASMLHGEAAGSDVCGVVTSGGSESLVTSVFTYREAGRDRGITRPNIVVPVTAHVAINKGAYWLDVEVRRAPVGTDYLADVDAVRDLVDDDTVAIYGSAGNYGHGLIDPITALGEVALERGVGLHVDGCLGGFLLPWAEKLGYDVPPWDFRVPGVTSISADTHKYGYALKGTSTLLYRSKDLRKHQYFTFPDWPGGLYLSPGLPGSRSGGLIASTWASLLVNGEEGYLDAADRILSTAARIKQGIRDDVPELEVIGDPLFLVAFRSDEVDVYLVNDELKRRGWRMNSLQLPPALHFCVTRPNTNPGVADAFLVDLRAAVDYALQHKGTPAQSGAMYGFGGTPQGNETISAVMSGLLDAMHEPAPSAS